MTSCEEEDEVLTKPNIEANSGKAIYLEPENLSKEQ
jgi:hypothetical protein